MASQEDRRALTRKRILRSAAELFAKNGFENTTIAQIVARANVVKGTFYQHFQTKMDLLVVLGREDGAERVRNLMEEVRQGASALDALLRYYREMARWLEAQPRIAEDVIFSAIRLHDPNSNLPEQVAHDFTKLMLQAAQENGEVRSDIDINSQVCVIGGAVTLAIIDWCRNPGNSRLQERCNVCFEIFLCGVKPVPGTGKASHD